MNNQTTFERVNKFLSPTMKWRKIYLVIHSEIESYKKSHMYSSSTMFDSTENFKVKKNQRGNVNSKYLS